ncbi:MAG: heat shock protein HspQ [Rhodospirillales bacterium]|nr:heat shock protein HspQ [Rhodospirillales bacterium]
MADQNAKFFVGQIVRHRMFQYRGVIFDIDPEFANSDEWYDAMAQSRPPKDQPWYHVLVHGETHTTYVAERNLEDDPSGASINHPAVNIKFASYGDGRYISAQTMN